MTNFALKAARMLYIVEETHILATKLLWDDGSLERMKMKEDTYLKSVLILESMTSLNIMKQKQEFGIGM